MQQPATNATQQENISANYQVFAPHRDRENLGDKKKPNNNKGNSYLHVWHALPLLFNHKTTLEIQQVHSLCIEYSFMWEGIPFTSKMIANSRLIFIYSSLQLIFLQCLSHHRQMFKKSFPQFWFANHVWWRKIMAQICKYKHLFSHRSCTNGHEITVIVSEWIELIYTNNLTIKLG